MAEILPRNIVIALIIVVFAFTGGLYMITGIYDAQEATLPDSIINLNTSLSPVDTQISSFANNISAAYQPEKTKGWVSEACTGLLGDDNFFCAGLETLGSVTSAPSNAELTLKLFQSEFPIYIPSWVYSTILSIMIVTIIFVILSAYRRYRS